MTRPRVLFDARLAVRGLGIASATARLTAALREQGSIDLRVNLAAGGWNRRGKLETIARSGLLDLNPGWDPRTRPGDVVHYFGNTAPQLPGRHTVITVQDLMSLGSSARKARLFRTLLVPGLRRTPARHVVATSSQTADDLLAFLPHLGPDVTVIPHGRREGLFWPGARTHVLMFGGQSDPRKRVDLGLAAYSAYAARVTDPLPLTIAGRAGVDPELVARQVTHGRVALRPDPSDDEVATLLRTAACLVYPSREEGFGLPLVEAGEVGTPVLCEAGARLPTEPLGPHAVRVDGTDPTDWGDGLAHAVGLGPVPDALAHLPTWSQIAHTYCEVYAEVAR